MSIEAQFDRIDEEIDGLREDLESCARGILVSRVAIWGGLAILALAFTFVPSLNTPVAVLGSIAAVMGGVVWYGATKSTREGLEERIAEIETRRSGLFDAVAARNNWRDLTPTIH